MFTEESHFLTQLNHSKHVTLAARNKYSQQKATWRASKLVLIQKYIFWGFFFCSQAPQFFKTIAFLLPQPSELTFNLQYFRCHNINILPKAGSISAELSSLAELTHLGTSKIPVQDHYGLQGTGSLRIYYKHNS